MEGLVGLDGKSEPGTWYQVHATVAPPPTALHAPIGVIIVRKSKNSVFYDSVVTSDETWIHYESTALKRQRLSPVNLYKEQLSRANQALRQQGVNTAALKYLHNNARPHAENITLQKIDELGWELLSHPPYSPDLGPSDYHLFRSRLHLISTLAQEMKDYVYVLRENKSHSFEGLKVLQHLADPNYTRLTSRIIFHVDLDCFFVSVALRDRPDLVGKPVAITHSKGVSAGFSELASVSYAARKCGLQNGMIVRDALKLCPNLVCLPYLFDDYRQISKTIYSIVTRSVVSELDRPD
ncbi:unnamed protein product [Heligmosomoides polygyrus]|uniref:UmuC domain-containing protein n=1 Tax=Heligmosomoides polygyrus TaxID=6339 RepID=A0A183G5M2_HELPZ|nr:unnamed protein product [Heligmosomoides polygyrus]